MDKIYQWISDLFKVNLNNAKIIFFGTIVFIILVIALIIVLCVTNSKKKTKSINSKEKIITKEEDSVKENDSVKEETIISEQEKDKENTDNSTQDNESETKVALDNEPVEETKTEEEKTNESNETKDAIVEENSNVISNDANVEKVKEKKSTKKTTKKVEDKKEDEIIEKKEKTSKQAVGKFTISQEGNNYRYRLKASNGELLVVSELYASETSARTGISTIKKNAENAVINIVEDKHGLFSFRIMTSKGRCLATSANYKTKAGANSASKSFKKFVNTDKIELEETSDHFEVEEFTKEITPEEKGKYKLNQTDDGFVYKLYASNGRIIATSQNYKTITSCKDGLEKFRNLAYEGTFFIFKDKNDKYQFKLYNKQKRMILAGEVYDTKDRVVSAIESIKRFAKLAEVVDVESPIIEEQVTE